MQDKNEYNEKKEQIKEILNGMITSTAKELLFTLREELDRSSKVISTSKEPS